MCTAPWGSQWHASPEHRRRRHLAIQNHTSDSSGDDSVSSTEKFALGERLIVGAAARICCTSEQVRRPLNKIRASEAESQSVFVIWKVDVAIEGMCRPYNPGG